MRLHAASLYCALLIAFTASGQYRLATEVPVFHGSHQLANPWAGGLNNPQFSHFDLNRDGLQDLVIYDKGDFRFHPFLNDGGVGQTEYLYAPEYIEAFPVVTDWALLYDYDNDGIQDIFAYIGAGVACWKGGYDAEDYPTFSLVKDKIRYVNGSLLTPVYASRVDLPGFADVNGDGDMDIFAFGSLGGFIRYYENRSAEEGWGSDSLLFDLSYNCWGHWLEGTTCKGGTLDEFCFAGPDLPDDQRGALHAGSTILVVDKNGDGVKDLLVGDAGCVSLTLLRNGGDNITGDIYTQDIKFPSDDVSVLQAAHASAFGVDLDQDGNRDVLVSPNDTQEGFNDRNVWYYRNVSSDSLDPDFVTDSFLVDGMIDAGTGSRPVVADINQDGLLDILIGVANYYTDTAVGFSYGMTYYRNTGSLDEPAFELVTRDFSGLSVHGIPNLSPALGDLDGDGDLDMMSGDAGGNLHYFENIAAAGAEMQLELSETLYQGINVGTQSAPALFDVNRDGLLDLIIGERNGNLNYWRNIGTASSAFFLEETDFWGAVDVRAHLNPSGYSVPFLRINSGNQLELYVGSLWGGVHRYSNLDGNLLGTFTENDSIWKGLDGGEFASLFLADINNDEAMDAFFGNTRGGLMLYTEKGQPVVSVSAPAQGLGSLLISPNPADDFVELSLPSEGFHRLEVSDLMGRTVLLRSVRNQSGIRIELTGLQAGIYLLRLDAEDGTVYVGRFVKTVN